MSQYSDDKLKGELMEVLKGCQCDCEKSPIFSSCMARDYTIVLLAVVVIIMLFWAYFSYGSMGVDRLDNRPRWPLGGLRDDTGATNSPTIFADGYGLDMTTNGAKTWTPGFDVRLGRSTYTAGGLTQGEYNGWGVMERGGKPTARPASTVHPAVAAALAANPAASTTAGASTAAKEGFGSKKRYMSNKESAVNKPTEDSLRKAMMSNI